MHTPQRIYRTLEGDLVLEGHPDAAYLAYGESDEVENRDQATVTKLLAKPADKQASKPRNK